MDRSIISKMMIMDFKYVSLCSKSRHELSNTVFVTILEAKYSYYLRRDLMCGFERTKANFISS